MTTRFKVFANLYKDSVTLMQLGARLRERKGIAQASCLMATPANLAQLLDADLSIDTQASPSDLLVVVRGDPTACDDAIAAADVMLQAAGGSGDSETAAFSLPLTSLALGVARAPDADLALISVPGDYAAAEAMKALSLGLHVMLFSDNVSIAEERIIKTYAAHTRSARDGARLRDGDRQRRAARLRQRGAPRRHRPRRRFGNRAAGSHLPYPQPGWRHLAGAWHGRSRSDRGDWRYHDAAGACGARCRPPDARHRADLQAARASYRPRRSRTRPAAAGKPVVVHFLGATPQRLPAGLVVATSLRARRRRRRGAGSRRAAADGIGAAIGVRDRGRRQVGGRDGADPDGGSRAVYRRHVLLRGATRVHRTRLAVPFQCAGRRRVAVRRPLRRSRLPRPGR